MEAVYAFQDKIHELAQIKDYVGVSSRTDVLECPETAAVLHEMETLVTESPEIVDFYAGAIKRYREGDAESIASELAIIKDRVELMASDDLFTKSQEAKLKTKISSGEIVKEEAELFFSMFKRVIPKQQLPGASARPTLRSTAKRRGPNQARTLDLTIEPHGGIRINGKFLRALSPAQKVIILSGLAKGEGFRNNEIYRSEEFARAADMREADESELRATYDEVFKSLVLYLKESRFGRLVDAKRKPGEKKHIISADSITDLRSSSEPAKPAKIVTPTELVQATQPGRFYENSKDDENPTLADAEKATDNGFSEDLLQDAHTCLRNMVAEHGGVKRRQAVDHLSGKFGLDVDRARALVTAVYKLEQEDEASQFRQVKEGGAKWFKPYRASDHEPLDETPKLFGDYFDGSLDELRARYGNVTGLLPEYVNFERGIIQLTGNERVLLQFFMDNGIRKAISEKAVISELKQQGIEITKEQIRESVRVVNALYGRDFMLSLGPARRQGAAKGLRVQRIGSFIGE